MSPVAKPGRPVANSHPVNYYKEPWREREAGIVLTDV